jgi:outer membrane protein OmpA-like peptidoglycan-associated protein
MRRHPHWKLRVAGHTDSIGGMVSNLELSRRRAESVREALGKLGVSLSRLEATGYGAAVPKETNTTIEGRARNRRVELTRG